MAEPTAPQIPNDAPQDVKDFFDCKGNTLNWQSGDVTWLGLKVTPSVTFAPGANRGEVNITVGLLGGMVSFTLPASVNAAGELVVDTSSVPDLSEWGLGGRADIDAAIKRINDWFKHNGKKLKPARLAGGTVVLEKVPIGPAPAVAPITGPVTPRPPAPTPPPPLPPPAAAPATGSGCSLLFVLMALLFVGAIGVGGYVGFVYFGGPGQIAVASASVTPTPYPTYPGPSPTPEPTATPSPAPIVTATPSVSPSPAPSVTAPAQIGMFTAVCIRVVHEQVGEFVSYLDWFVAWADESFEYFEITVLGANNGEPQVLEFDSRWQAYHGLLGLDQAGDKRIVSVIGHLSDGSQIDLTEEMADYFGSDEFTVRYPAEDSFGDCEIFGTTTQ